MAAKVVTYAVALAELTLAMVMFARTLDVGRTSALAAALLAALLVFPFYGTGAIYPIAALAPHDVTFIAVTLLIASAFLRFGRRGVLQDLPYAAAVLVLTLWFVHAAVGS